VYTECLYGVRLLSAWPLTGARVTAGATRQIRLVDGSTTCAREFEEAAGLERVPGDEWWLYCTCLTNGGVFIRWANQFEFIVAPRGDVITARMVSPASTEAFHACLLGVAFSFALIKQGIEPLHATAVVVDGAAVAFVGESGEGKSALAAAFIGAGHRLVTDDLLVATPDGDTLVVHPGPPRIKLFREMIALLPGRHDDAWPLSDGHSKQLIPLSSDFVADAAVPLRAVYVLDGPADGERAVTISRLSGRESALALLESTFNIRLTDPARLRQNLDHVTRLADEVPVSVLSYARRLDLLPEVVTTVLADIADGRG
jgi:hypothetical protein